MLNQASLGKSKAIEWTNYQPDRKETLLHLFIPQLYKWHPVTLFFFMNGWMDGGCTPSSTTRQKIRNNNSALPDPDGVKQYYVILSDNCTMHLTVVYYEWLRADWGLPIGESKAKIPCTILMRKSALQSWQSRSFTTDLQWHLVLTLKDATHFWSSSADVITGASSCESTRPCKSHQHGRAGLNLNPGYSLGETLRNSEEVP